jgi:alcohol dehydrogenase class IV
VVAAGVADRCDRLVGNCPRPVYSDVEPNPSGATIEKGAAALRTYGLGGSVIVAIGGGSAMDRAKAIATLRANDRPVWELEYDGADLAPGIPIIAVPTTAGTGSEAHPFLGHHPRGDRSEGLHRPPLATARDDDPRSSAGPSGFRPV